jgi:hypothetical protein
MPLSTLLQRGVSQARGACSGQEGKDSEKEMVASPAWAQASA